MEKYKKYEARESYWVMHRGYLFHRLQPLLLVFFVISSYSQAELMEASNLAAYPKASEDATIVYRLQSNMERTRFLIDGKEMGIGRKLTVRINNQGHTIVAQPEGCAKSKEEFVQPPYNPEVPLSFTFVSGECESKARTASINNAEESDSRAKPQIHIGSSTGNIYIVTADDISGTVSQEGHRTQNTITPKRDETPARKTQDKNSAALREIQEFVKNVCPSTKNNGRTENLQLSGNASAKLTGLLNKLADLGVEGAVIHQKKDYEGVLQQDLAGLLSKDIDCRTAITKMLIEKLIK